MEDKIKIECICSYLLAVHESKRRLYIHVDSDGLWVFESGDKHGRFKTLDSLKEAARPILEPYGWKIVG